MHSRRSDMVGVAFLALLSNLTYLYFSNGDYFFPDSATYIVPARNLLRSLGFVSERGIGEVFRTPGYPMLLVPFLALSRSFVPLLVLQHLLNTLLAVAAYAFACRFAASRAAGLTAGIVFALDLPSIHYANKVLSESLFTALLFALCALVLRVRRRGATAATFIAGGLLAGALVLVRPVAILYFAIPALLLFWIEGKRAAIFAAAALLLPIGWSVRNFAETGVFTISTVAGTNMLLHRAAPALAIVEDDVFERNLADYQAELLEQAKEEILEAEDVDSLDEVEGAKVTAYYGRIGRRIALRHPVGLSLVIVRGLIVNLFDSDWDALAQVTRTQATIVEWAMTAWIPIVITLAAVGMLALSRRDPFAATLLAATIFYFIFLSAGSEAEARFRVPVMPQICVLAGVGVEAVRRGVNQSG